MLNLLFVLLPLCPNAAARAVALSEPQPAVSSQATEAPYLPKANPESVGMSAQELAEIDGVVKQLIQDKQIAGAVTIVVRDGKVVYESAAGHRNLKRQQPMEIDSLFRIYSMTKPLVSTAVMILREEGKLNLDDPVFKHLSAFEDVRVYKSGSGEDVVLETPARPMTLRDLLRHTSGMTYGLYGDTVVDRMYRSADIFQQDSLVAVGNVLAELPLLFSPGEKWNYSMSPDLLGLIVQVVAQEPLEEFLQRRIFDPLAMQDTGFFVPEDQRDRFTTSYGSGFLNKLQVVDDAEGSRFLGPPNYPSGGGGLISTGPDYARFCQMLLNRGTLDGVRILSPNSVGEMTRNQLPDSAFPIGFGNTPSYGVGFGLGFSVVVDGDRRHGEYGWGGAASTHFWISPMDNLFVVTFSQYQPFDSVLPKQIAPVVYDAILNR